MNGFYDANHFGGGKLPLKHRPDGLSAFNRSLGHLMIDRIVVVEFSQARSIGALKRSTQVFTTCLATFLVLRVLQERSATDMGMSATGQNRLCRLVSHSG